MLKWVHIQLKLKLLPTFTVELTHWTKYMIIYLTDMPIFHAKKHPIYVSGSGTIGIVVALDVSDF